MTLPDDILKTTQADLDRLVNEGTQEGPHLDFKRALPESWNDKAKHDLVSDATAFANAGGGCLIYGIDQNEEGAAAALVPQVFNPDDDSMRMASLLRDLSEPRMPGCRIHAVPVKVGDKEGHVVVVQVPQSWARPHRVKTNQHFFLRDGRQSRPIDVPELRGMFMRSESQAQRIRDFRTERIARVLMGETPKAIIQGVIVLLHLVPTQAALGAMQVDPLSYANPRAPGARRLPVFGLTSTSETRMTLEGIAGIRTSLNGKASAYSLLFRNGFFEAARVHTGPEGAPSARFPLPHETLESECIRLVEGFCAELIALGIASELTAMLSILNADRGVLNFDRNAYMLDADEGYFDRKHVVLPDVLLSSEVPAEQGMRPVLDLMWQASNIQRSPSFDEQGRFKPHLARQHA